MNDIVGRCHDCTALQTEVNMLSRHILELQKDKGELTDRVRELEAEVKEWKDKADLWCKTANLKDHNIMINKELEKENAELKSELSENKVADYHIVNGLCKQLTRAKEIIKNIIRVTWGEGWNYSLDWKVKAEQFLSSEVEK